VQATGAARVAQAPDSTHVTTPLPSQLRVPIAHGDGHGAAPPLLPEPPWPPEPPLPEPCPPCAPASEEPLVVTRGDPVAAEPPLGPEHPASQAAASAATTTAERRSGNNLMAHASGAATVHPAASPPLIRVRPRGFRLECLGGGANDLGGRATGRDPRGRRSSGARARLSSQAPPDARPRPSVQEVADREEVEGDEIEAR
jgi:hypothetical protein